MFLPVCLRLGQVRHIRALDHVEQQLLCGLSVYALTLVVRGAALRCAEDEEGREDEAEEGEEEEVAAAEGQALEQQPEQSALSPGASSSARGTSEHTSPTAIPQPEAREQAADHAASEPPPPSQPQTHSSDVATPAREASDPVTSPVEEQASETKPPSLSNAAPAESTKAKPPPPSSAPTQSTGPPASLSKKPSTRIVEKRGLVWKKVRANLRQPVEGPQHHALALHSASAHIHRGTFGVIVAWLSCPPQGGGSSFVGRQSWKERYFVLTGPKLQYYESEFDYSNHKEPIKGITYNIAQCTVAITQDMKTQIASRASTSGQGAIFGLVIQPRSVEGAHDEMERGVCVGVCLCVSVLIDDVRPDVCACVLPHCRRPSPNGAAPRVTSRTRRLV